ncbi:MAG: alpha/beta fold hydrolase [Leucothrix sp.]
MARQKITFKNDQGIELAGLLETPADPASIRSYALFAHCFTCGKDIAAASRIARALTQYGIAVFRFDFTGLGNSDGDFGNTNFSSNVEDLLAAYRMLAQDFAAPQLLIGHSLGGAAILSAADRMPLVKALATIGSPSTADHVQHLFHCSMEELAAKGKAEVNIGLRKFTIKKQLIDDLQQHTDTDHIAQLRRPLMIFHSPIDTVVPVAEAAKIFTAAKHPKSFVSLDDADHLLVNAKDAEFVAQTLASWADRYIDAELSNENASRQAKQTSVTPANHNLSNGEVLVTEKDQKFLRGLLTPDHQLLADEPTSYGGSNLGPSPYDLLLMALGACTSMTMRMYANHKKLALADVNVRLKHERIHSDDCADCDGLTGKIERITREVELKGDLTEAQRKRLIEIADRCPVHLTLENDLVVQTKEMHRSND